MIVLFTDFGPTQVVTGASNFVSVCVKMEHSWLRDLQIDLISPSGQMIALQTFLGQTGSEVFMGTPVDDDDIAPVPGTGADYCWTPTSLRPPMLTYANQSFLHDLPAGNYSPAQPFSNLVGAMLNGDWTLKVTDLWAIDNGYIFEWSIAFDPTIVQDCSTPPIQ